MKEKPEEIMDSVDSKESCVMWEVKYNEGSDVKCKMNVCSEI